MKNVWSSRVFFLYIFLQPRKDFRHKLVANIPSVPISDIHDFLSEKILEDEDFAASYGEWFPLPEDDYDYDKEDSESQHSEDQESMRIGVFEKNIIPT